MKTMTGLLVSLISLSSMAVPITYIGKDNNQKDCSVILNLNRGDVLFEGVPEESPNDEPIAFRFASSESAFENAFQNGQYRMDLSGVMENLSARLSLRFEDSEIGGFRTNFANKLKRLAAASFHQKTALSNKKTRIICNDLKAK